jgi:hypothetical protein
MCSVGWNTTLIVVLLQAAVSADEAKLKQLQKERLAALAQVAEMKHRAFQRGEIPLSEYASAYE